jgi:hypothetical protein
MPRQNIYQLPATDLSRQRPKLTPISTLTKAERRAFNYIVAQNPHLGLADVLLVEAFAVSYCRTMGAKRKGTEIWERENRILLLTATKLRCTAQSYILPRGVGRTRAAQHGGPKPWDPLPDDTDDE